MLEEAEAEGSRGSHLGPVASLFLLHVLLSRLARQPDCYLNRAPTWRPSEDRNTLYKLLHLANEQIRARNLAA